MTEEFKPWDAAKSLFPITIKVAAPPCPGCVYWRPVATTDQHGTYNGVVLCHHREMEHDFSCFKARESPVK